MCRAFWIAIGLTLSMAGARAQFASPPPAATRGSSSSALSETFTPDTLFPKKTEPPKVPPAPPAEPDPNAPDGGLLPPPPPKIWAGSGDLGLTGATGNSELFNLRSNWNVRRKTDTNALTSDFQYVYSQKSGATQTHQALYNSRDEILFPGSRWSAFGASQIEYDEFRAYRFRVGAYVGAGFRFVDEPDLTFKTRLGAGAERELGSDGLPSRWLAEFVVGYDFRYKMTERSQVVSIVDVYPRIEDVRQFRSRVRFAYEYLIDPKWGMIYRVGLQDRYDSDPGNAKRNDLTYFTTIGFKF